MNVLEHKTQEEKINFRIREIESVLGYVKSHLSSGALTKALKETQALNEEVEKLIKVLKNE